MPTKVMKPVPPVAGLGAFAHDLDLTERLKPFASRAWSPAAPPGPVLHLEDVSAIPFLTDIPGVEEYQHRARVRAKTGDLYATVTPPDPAYDDYCVETIDIGRPEWVDARTTNDPLNVARACLNRVPFSRLLEVVREAGTLVIHPYMSIDDVWVLAEQLAHETGSPVSVLGSPPPVTWIANDKALFTRLVTLVLGPGWTTETHEAQEPAALATLVRDIAGRYPSVGLKRTRCASAMGNLVLRSSSVNEESVSATETTVSAFLTKTEWPGNEPVLVVAWEDAASSPSTQWWIPPTGHGEPRLDGIYEQILEGDRKVFVGSRPSTLPAHVEDLIGSASGQVARALQHLGYVGRCSFDHLVVGDPGTRFTVRFTECNGRWGGTSTPMHLVDRVVAGPRPAYRAQDFSHDRLSDFPFADILSRLGADVFDRHRQTGRFIFYNLGPLRTHGKLDVIAIGKTQAEAEQALLADLPRRLAL